MKWTWLKITISQLERINLARMARGRQFSVWSQIQVLCPVRHKPVNRILQEFNVIYFSLVLQMLMHGNFAIFDKSLLTFQFLIMFSITITTKESIY